MHAGAKFCGEVVIEPIAAQRTTRKKFIYVHDEDRRHLQSRNSSCKITTAIRPVGFHQTASTRSFTRWDQELLSAGAGIGSHTFPHATSHRKGIASVPSAT